MSEKVKGVRKALWPWIWQIPLIGAAAVGWKQWVVDHPWTALAFAIIYEIFVISFIVIKKVCIGLEKKLVPILTEWSWIAILNFFSRFRRRYNAQVIYDHRVFNVRGLLTRGTYVLDVEKVFVELRIAPGHLQQAGVNPIAFKEVQGSQPIWEFLRRMKGKGLAALGIIGPPGSGKTTLLQHIALILAANKQSRYKLRPYTPLFLFLRDAARHIREEAPSLAELAQKHFSDPQRYPRLKPPPQWFQRRLARGKYLVLLDGLDEVGDKDLRETVSGWVDDQVRTYPGCLFLVTSRPGGYRDAPLSRAHVLEVMPFDAGQAARFVHNWYLATKILSYGKDDPGVRQDAEQQSRELLSRLRSLPALSALTVNPLLLTMVAMVHNYRGALPGRRVELYNEICDVLLGHRQKGKGVDQSLTAAQKRAVLQPFAAFIMSRQGDRERRTISFNEAMAFLTPLLEEVGLGKELIPGFLKDLQESSGLFLETEQGMWSFAHLTFQEYLCACFWEKSAETASRTKEQWRSYIDDSWWHETLRLYTAQGDATALAEACLDLDTVDSLSLAADISEEALKLGSKTRKELKRRLEQDLESKDPAKARLAAQVCLNQRLKKNFQSIDDRRAIDTTMINCAEYQLFLDYMRNGGVYRQPDHWTSFHFKEGEALKPISGVRFQDAMAFCKWLSQTQGQTFRLPWAEESDVFPGTPEALPVSWAISKKLPGLSPGIELKLRVELTKESRLPSPPVLARARDHYLDHDLAGVLAIAGVFARALDRARARAGVLVLARALVLALDLDLALALDRDHALDLALVRSRDHDHALALALTRDFPFKKELFSFDKIATAIKSSRPGEAMDLIEKILSTGLQEGERRLFTLLYDAVRCAAANTFVELRQAIRDLAIGLLEYAYEGLLLSERIERPYWQRLLLPWKKDLEIEKLKQEVLDNYWFLRMVRMREQGKLPAWEGIRLVREYKELEE